MKHLLLSLLLITTSLVFSRHASAQEVGISVHPSVVQIQSYNTKAVQGTITIKNISQQKITISYSLMHVQQQPETGEIVPAVVNSQYLNLFQHIQVLLEGKPATTFDLLGLESKQITFKLIIPESLKSQDYQFAILFTPKTNAPNNTSASLIHPSLGTTFLISHSPVTKRVTISSFSSPSFLDHGPVPFDLKVYNPDSSINSLRGTISIYSLFGSRLATIPLQNASLLSGTTELLHGQSNPLQWSEKWLWGAYSARVNIVSSNGQVTTKTIHFIGFPLLLIFLITAIGMILIGIVIKTLRKT